MTEEDVGEADGERKRKGAVNNVEKARKSCTGKPDTSYRRPFFLIIDTRPHSLWAATNILSDKFPQYGSISSSLPPSIVTQSFAFIKCYTFINKFIICETIHSIGYCSPRWQGPCRYCHSLTETCAIATRAQLFVSCRYILDNRERTPNKRLNFSETLLGKYGRGLNCPLAHTTTN